MRAHRIPIEPPRVESVMIPHKKILSYGEDNCYPQKMKRILQKSPTGMGCANLFSRFIRGKGFEDEAMQQAVVNMQGQRLQGLYNVLAKDLAEYGFFAVHVNYNLLAEPTTFSRVNPEYVRLGIPDSYGIFNRVAIYDQWDGRNRTNPDPVDIQYLDLWHPDPERVLSQINRDGGIGRYKGQIYLYTGDELRYPTTPYDSVFRELLTEAEIGEYNYTRLKRGFVGKHILAYRGTFTDEQLEATKMRLRQVSGPDGDDILLVDGIGDDGLDLMEIKHNQAENLYGEVETAVRAKIMRAWNQNPILHGDFRPGSLGQSTEIENAFRFYNAATEDTRRTLSRCFADMFERWAFGEYENFDVVPLSFESDGNTQSMGE